MLLVRRSIKEQVNLISILIICREQVREILTFHTVFYSTQ